jgi:hypothetical protein
MPMVRPRRVAIVLVMIGGMAGAEARAQGPDPAAAADLFHEGREAMSTHSYVVACGKFAESQRLDPRVGTLINLALCEEALGLVATARQHWEQATDLAQATGDTRVAYTTERLGIMDRRVPRLIVRLGTSAPPGTVVHRDDVELGAASLGVWLPVDPGKHTVFAGAGHHADGPVTMVELREGESKEVVVETGDLLQDAIPSPVVTVPTMAPALGAEHPLATMRRVALATSVAGVVGLGVGSYFGLQAIAHANGSPGVCHGQVCDAQGATVRRGAIQSADEATVAFVVGGALVAAGIAMWILAPAPSALEPSIGVVPGVVGLGPGASIQGVF